MTVILDSADVRSVADIPGVVSDLEAAYRYEAHGSVQVADRVNLMSGESWLRLMAAAVPPLGVLGYKAFHLVNGTVRYVVTLIDLDDGAVLAMLDADYLTALRTAATAGLAATYLAPAATTLGVIGSGAEARMQTRVLCALLPVERVAVFSPRAERRERFARDLADETGLTVDTAEEPGAATSNAEVVVVATNTGTGGPAFDRAWIPDGSHVSSIGSTLPSQRELAVDVWGYPDTIVVDTPQVLEESGDAIAASEAGTLDTKKVITLASLCADGNRPFGRTLYKSVGSPVQDVVVATSVYRRARELGLGTSAPDFLSIKPVQPR